MMKNILPSMQELSWLHLAWIVGNYIEGGGDPKKLNRGAMHRGEYEVLAKALGAVGYIQGAGAVRNWIEKHSGEFWDSPFGSADLISGLTGNRLRKASVDRLASFVIEYLTFGSDPGALMLNLKSKGQYEVLAVALEQLNWPQASGRVRTWIATRGDLSEKVVDFLKAAAPKV